RLYPPVSAASRWNGRAFTKTTLSPADGPCPANVLAWRYYTTVRASVLTAGRIKMKRVRSSLYTINESTLSFGMNRDLTSKLRHSVALALKEHHGSEGAFGIAGFGPQMMAGVVGPAPPLQLPGKFL